MPAHFIYKRARGLRHFHRCCMMRISVSLPASVPWGAECTGTSTVSAATAATGGRRYCHHRHRHRHHRTPPRACVAAGAPLPLPTPPCQAVAWSRRWLWRRRRRSRRSRCACASCCQECTSDLHKLVADLRIRVHVAVDLALAALQIWCTTTDRCCYGWLYPFTTHECMPCGPAQTWLTC